MGEDKWPPNNMGVKMQNAVRDMVDACNDSGSIVLNEDGSAKQFICPNTYYDNAGEGCWKKIKEGDDVCVRNDPDNTCDPDALDMGTLLKSPECSRAYAKASIMHGERTDDGITWEQPCDTNGNCHLFPNPYSKVGEVEDGERAPDDVAPTHPLLTDNATEVYNDKRIAYCNTLSNSNEILKKHNNFWTGGVNSPASAMAGSCRGGCMSGYQKIRPIMNDETSKAMITNSALVGMYQGLDCSSLESTPSLCQIHPDGNSTTCSVPSELNVKPSKYKEGCGKKCQQEIEALLSRLQIASQNVYFNLKLVAKYEGAYQEGNEFGKRDNLKDIVTVLGEPGGISSTIETYFKTLRNWSEENLDSANITDAEITDKFGLLFKDPRTAKYLRLAGKSYLEVSLIEKKIMAIYMFTHKSLNSRINSIKSEVKKIVESNQEELDRLRENAHTKVRGISKRQHSMENNRLGVVSMRVSIVVMVLFLLTISSVPEAGKKLKYFVDTLRRK